MTEEFSQFSHLTKFFNTSPIVLVDESSSSILGLGVVYPIPSSPFKLNYILYVPKFSINLLSIY